MLGDIIDAIARMLQDIFHWFQTVAPGGFGLILIPLIILGALTILVSRKP